MGGVDNLSRVWYHTCWGAKWYRKLAEIFIDFAIYNSYIVYMEKFEQHQRDKPSVPPTTD